VTKVERVLKEEAALGPETVGVMIIVKVALKVGDTAGARDCANTNMVVEMGRRT